MLSKELNKLELNGLITRTTLETRPVMVQYELTEYALSLKSLTDEMSAWGKQHREKIVKEMTIK
jgi:DNA-binding HxlR family transcriptional regulator